MVTGNCLHVNYHLWFIAKFSFGHMENCSVHSA